MPINDRSRDPAKWSARKLVKQWHKLTADQRKQSTVKADELRAQVKPIIDEDRSCLVKRAAALGVRGFDPSSPRDWAHLEAVVRNHVGLERGELLDLLVPHELLGYLDAAQDPTAKDAGVEIPIWDRLEILAEDGYVAELDDATTHPLPNKEVADFLRVLKAKQGVPVSGATFRNGPARIDATAAFNGTPEAIRRFIHKPEGKGVRTGWYFTRNILG